MSKTVIVTGGCGYIGSHVARAFKQEGYTVHVVDTVYREHTVKGLDGHLINCFASKAALSMYIMLQPDIIVHCAGTSLVGPSVLNPAEYYENNVTKTLTMMNVIKDMPKKPVVMFSSSASVYGIPKESPIEETAPLQPISPYGNTKMTVEKILGDYSSAYDIDTICFRYFNAAGAHPDGDLGQEPEATHLIARVLEASINKRLVTINGDDFDTLDGTCVRDYIHVWDVALAHVQAAKYADDIQTRPRPMRLAIQLTLNLGTGSGCSNKEIVDYVYDTYGLTTVKYGLRRDGDPDRLVADCILASITIGWTPQHSSPKNIIDSAYKWYTRK